MHVEVDLQIRCLWCKACRTPSAWGWGDHNVSISLVYCKADRL